MREPKEAIVASKYPFEDWLDGRVWLLRPDIDFECQPESMQSMLHHAARQSTRGVEVATRVVPVMSETFTSQGYGVLVQAYGVGSTWRPRLQMIDSHRIKKAMANPR